MIHIVIPARYGSSRLPGKPLRLIKGMTMIERVYRQAEKTDVDSIWVATDDDRIQTAVEAFNGRVIMTDSNHASGTDRLAEVCALNKWDDDDIVVNVQGDEPLMPPEIITLLAQLASDTQAGMCTLATPVVSKHDLLNPNVVKVVLDDNDYACYFSRATIPWYRDQYDSKWLNDTDDATLPSGTSALRHLGMYAYRVKTLKAITQLTECPLEKAEALEQLRPLYHGISIKVGTVQEAPAHGVDTEEDLIRVEALLH